MSMTYNFFFRTFHLQVIRFRFVYIEKSNWVIFVKKFPLAEFNHIGMIFVRIYERIYAPELSGLDI